MFRVIILEDELEKLVCTKETQELLSEAYPVLEQRLKLIEPHVQASNSCWEEAISQVDRLLRRNTDAKACTKVWGVCSPQSTLSFICLLAPWVSLGAVRTDFRLPSCGKKVYHILLAPQALVYTWSLSGVLCVWSRCKLLLSILHCHRGLREVARLQEMEKPVPICFPRTICFPLISQKRTWSPGGLMKAVHSLLYWLTDLYLLVDNWLN